MKRLIAVYAICASTLLALAVGCAHPLAVATPGGGGTPSPGPSPSPTSTSSPSPCGTQNTQIAEYIAMTSTASATADPTYGIIDGYTDQYDAFGSPSQIATVITLPPSTPLQFVNLEPLPNEPPAISHSAAALPTAFPSPSYTFPPDEEGALGTQISSQPWSTGPIGQDLIGGNICYSQTFSAPSSPGVYAFGDLQYFGLSNMRDVVVVSADAPRRRARVPRRIRATPRP